MIEPSRMRAVQRAQLQQQRRRLRGVDEAPDSPWRVPTVVIDAPPPPTRASVLRHRLAAGITAAGPILGVAALAALAALAGISLGR